MSAPNLQLDYSPGKQIPTLLDLDLDYHTLQDDGRDDVERYALSKS